MDKDKKYIYLINQILGENRHQFIYGYDNAMRKKLIEDLDREFPVIMDNNVPMSIHLNDIGFTSVDAYELDLDEEKINVLSREFLTFSIIYDILLKTKENIDVDLFNSRIERLLYIINKYDKNPDYSNITSLDDLISVVLESKEFSKVYYNNYLTGKKLQSIDEIALPFLQIESFITQYKKALNNGSHFAIIVDKKSTDIALPSIKQINSLIGSRINKNISMKVIVEPTMWESYITSNGQYVDNIHDYGTIELDDSHKEYVKRLKERNRL